MCSELVTDMELRIIPNLETFQLSPNKSNCVATKVLMRWTLLVQEFALIVNFLLT